MHLLRKLPDDLSWLTGCPPCDWAEFPACECESMEAWFAVNWRLWRGMEGMVDALVDFGKEVGKMEHSGGDDSCEPAKPVDVRNAAADVEVAYNAMKGYHRGQRGTENQMRQN